MKVKRKVAALLALAMVLTGKPAGVLAGAMPGDEGVASTKVVSDKIATPPKATPDEPEKELRAKVEYTILPEDGAHILNGASRNVKSGDTLKFSFVVKDDYELSSVNVDGDSDGVKISVDESDEDKYHCEYNVGDIVFDTTQVEIELTEASEEEPFSTVMTEDGLIFTITADAGVLPEGTSVEIKAFEDIIPEVAEDAKEKILREESEEDLAYSAYQIKLLDENEGDLLTDKDIKGNIKVTVESASDENDLLLEEEESTHFSVVNAFEITYDESLEKKSNISDITDSKEVLLQRRVSNKRQEATVKPLHLNKNEESQQSSFFMSESKITVAMTRADSRAQSISIPQFDSRTISVGDSYVSYSIMNLNSPKDGLEVTKEGSSLYVHGMKEGEYRLLVQYSRRTEEYNITVSEKNDRYSDAYFYLRKFGAADSSAVAGDYQYIGKGKVNLQSAEANDKGMDIPMENGLVTEEPTPQRPQSGYPAGYDQSGYPVWMRKLDDGTLKEYHYNETPTPNTYSIQWDYIREASGANGYPNREALVPDAIPTWHVDGTSLYVDEEDIQVIFRMQSPEQAGTENLIGSTQQGLWTERSDNFVLGEIQLEKETGEKVDAFDTLTEQMLSALGEKSDDYTVNWYWYQMKDGDAVDLENPIDITSYTEYPALQFVGYP